jgi:hypothetical protein
MASYRPIRARTQLASPPLGSRSNRAVVAAFRMSFARGALPALVVLLLSSSAGADAVPPPPDDCPPDKVPTTSHGGPQCEDPAPTNCPPGYRGYVGGRCELFPCSRNAECLKGERCREVPVCQEYRELYWTGWGWSRNDPPNRSNLIAEPPSDPPEGPPPKAWVPLDVCGPKGKCPEQAECRPLLLCYPDKEKPPAVVYPSGCSKGCALGSARGLPWVGAGIALLCFLWRSKRLGLLRAPRALRNSSRRSQPETP